MDENNTKGTVQMQEYKDLWESILASLREKYMTNITVDLWFKEAELVSFTD